MASWIESFTATFAAGTDTTVPLLFSRDVQVDRISMLFPQGSNGKLAVQLLIAKQQVIPPNTGQFLVVSGESLDWPINDLLTVTQWSIRGVNTGTFSHSVYLRFLCSEPPNPNKATSLAFGPSTQPINPASI